MRTDIETLVIGAGQAGLSAAYHLTRAGRSCVVVDSGDRVGDGWRRQWDTLRLYSPARYDGLPGMPFPGDPWHFPSKDAVADYLEAYAARFDLPVQLGVRVRRLTAQDDGYRVETEDGRDVVAQNVVVATGTFGRTPYVPETAGLLAPHMLQLHSSEYRRPEQLREGPVLVVGASHSGCDIAYEVAPTHRTLLVGPDGGQIPIRLDSRAMRALYPVLWFLWGHVLSRRTPVGRKKLPHTRFHGGPGLRVKRADLADRGVERLTSRVTGARGGLPLLADGTVTDVENVIWATGFRQDFSWIDLPVFDSTGWPREVGGVVDEAPGLFFCGLCFQSSFRSMLIGGAGADAEHVARHIGARTAALATR